MGEPVEENEERPVVICMNAVPNYIPDVMGSTLTQCDDCGCAVWVSPDTVLMDAKHVCINCTDGMDMSDVTMTGTTRDRLHAMGIKDEEIEGALARYREAMETERAKRAAYYASDDPGYEMWGMRF